MDVSGRGILKQDEVIVGMLGMLNVLVAPCHFLSLMSLKSFLDIDDSLTEEQLEDYFQKREYKYV